MSQVAGYKVKVMLAEPKTKRGRPDGSPQEMLYHMPQVCERFDSDASSTGWRWF